MNPLDFDTAFKALTGYPPFPWQRALYQRFISDRTDNIPASCNLPTGLGKTSVIAVWLIALANGHKVPRRLVYVVNRRTVVDQTTTEVEKYRDNSGSLGLPEKLAISTLRGQFADNREWSADPSRPAVICGTVDMIGSRLLFSGYGIGKTRPLHAGLLGQDALLVHDEAHLEPAFQKLLLDIEAEQKRCNDFRPLKVMELTATSRAGGDAFELTPEDYTNDTVIKRIGAKKAITLVPNKDEKKLAEEIGELALKHKDSGRAILVFVRKVDDVGKIVTRLEKEKLLVKQLTGTLRGLERDALVENEVFRRFLPKAEEKNETVYLVCTSAGEVGVNISADHLVCDLSTFESMAQRFGRVNRFGLRNDTEIHVVYPKEFDDAKPPEPQMRKTLELLRTLPPAIPFLPDEAFAGSPTALGNLDPVERQAAFSPQPTILPTSDILFDAWALTSIRDKLPGRPPVEPYLHGISDYDPPQTTVAWRDEVELLTPELLKLNKLDAETALDLFPLKPHEELSGPTYGRNKVFEQLEEVAARDAKREPDKRLSAWVVDPDGTVTIRTLAELVQKDKQNKPLVALGGRTVLLPPGAGGLSGGLLTGAEPHTPGADYDVSDRLHEDAEKTKQRRVRVWRDDADYRERTKGMRLIRRIEVPASDGDDAVVRSWLWYERPRGGDDDGSKSSATQNPITWEHHTKDVTDNTERIVAALDLATDLRTALTVAAKLHDLGKQRAVWQRSIGNPKPKEWFAKSGREWVARETTDYRHEFGSLIDTDKHEDFTGIKDELKAFVLHVIATHHGRGRPHFPADEVFDPERSDEAAKTVAREVPQRFARLQREYGRWGLAYLESLLRAADYAASANPSPVKTEGE